MAEIQKVLAAVPYHRERREQLRKIFAPAEMIFCDPEVQFTVFLFTKAGEKQRISLWENSVFSLLFLSGKYGSFSKIVLFVWK